MEAAVASAFLKCVIGRLFVVLEKEYNKFKGLAEETQSIQDDLRMIEAAMADRLCALGKSDRTAVARLYSEEMLDLAHDFEDCVDRFMHRVRCKQHGGGGAVSTLVRRFAHDLGKVQNKFRFADEIHKLKMRLKNAHHRIIHVVPLASSGQASGLLLSSPAASSMASRVTCNPVGVEKPMEEVLSLLDEVDGELEQLRVISIVGFGGLGKTTLARAVYDSPRARDKFHSCAWVASSSDSMVIAGDGRRGILRDILQQVLPKDTIDADDQHSEVCLGEFLKNRRYLIVIDDIRMDEWSAIHSTFQDNGTSSRIILTTTIQSVANMCSHGNGYVYHMNTLGEEDSKKIAFPGVRSPELEQGSAALLGKCDGLPLALVTISSYLKSSIEPTGELCAKLSRNLGCHLKENHGHDSFSELRKVLLDNYDSFSGCALTCLLYLCIFPNNHRLKRKVLTRRWLAEGYARSNSLHNEQDIAEENFNKLIDCNIIRPIDTRNNSKVKTCKTHGIMHEFVLHKSLSQRFMATSSCDRPRLGISAYNARHLSIHAGELKESLAFDDDLSRVRSLTVFGNAGDVISYVHKCKLIRVLDLEECSDMKNDDLKHICKLWHLKYLSFGDTISKLPRCIEGLYCLQTLDLRRTMINLLPIETILLPHLTHLFGKFMLDKDDLKNVKKMSKVQKFLSGNKSNLETLAGFITDERKGFLQLINYMKKLRKIKIWCKRVESYISTLSEAIQEFTKIPMDKAGDRSLALYSEEPSGNFPSSLDLELCTEGFKYDLRVLKLHGSLTRLPPFVTLMTGLTELCISSDTLTHDLLSVLVTLKRLLYLKLIANQLENFEIKHGAFPSLRRLSFVVQSLTAALLTLEPGALPNLVSLQLLCRGLVGLSGIEIRHLKQLKEITIDSAVTAQTRQNWERAAKKHPNRPRVLQVGMVGPTDSDDPEQCALVDKRKRCADQPSSDDGLDSSLKKLRLSEPHFLGILSDQAPSGNRRNAIVHQYSSSSSSHP